MKDEATYDTTFSACRLYRYLWKYAWNPKLPPLVIIGLNPSTADEKRKDPTVTRGTNFGAAWGYGALWMMNLFAYRATDPRVMKAAGNPIGPENNEWLITACGDAVHNLGGRVLAAWGNHGTHLNRSRDVVQLLSQNARVTLWALRLTKASQPQHPLYLPADLQPFEWRNSA